MPTVPRIPRIPSTASIRARLYVFVAWFQAFFPINFPSFSFQIKIYRICRVLRGALPPPGAAWTPSLGTPVFKQGEKLIENRKSPLEFVIKSKKSPSENVVDIFLSCLLESGKMSILSIFADYWSPVKDWKFAISKAPSLDNNESFEPLFIV